MSQKGRRTCWMSLMVMPSALSRSRITTSCVEPGQMATFLPLRSLIVLMSDFAPATTAMPRLHCAAKITSGSPAAAPSVAAAMPKVPKSTEPVTHRVLAVGRALERDDLDLVARGRELLVEVRRDAVDQLQRADLDDLFLGKTIGSQQAERETYDCNQSFLHIALPELVR